ncbi:MAG: hypothetical protein KAS32_28925 [Candidatus Peribacteraceae bacterium]|nr:hypothetical protein [Candidatus Peribacteraceae bacterium]
MQKKNCWEVKDCKDKLTCPAYKSNKLDGVHDGTAGGRACWAVAGTLCGGEVAGRFAQKTITCLACDFYKQVFGEEGVDFIGSYRLLQMLK